MIEATKDNLKKAGWWAFWALLLGIIWLLIFSVMQGQSSGPINTPLLNKAFYFVGTSPYATTIQSAVTAACASSPGGAIVIPAGVAPSDTIGAATGGCTKAWILDQRQVTEACYSWSGSAYTSTACATGTLTPGGGNYAIQYDNGGALGGVNFTGLVWNNGTSSPPSQATVTNVGTLGKLTNATSGNADTATALSGALSANQLLGSLTAVAPTGRSVPSCSGATNALTWTSGTGFGCNTFTGLPATSITVGSTTITSGTSGSVEYNNAGTLGERATTGTGTQIVSSTTATRTLGHLLDWSSAGDAIDSGILGTNVGLLNATQTWTGLNTWSQTAQFNSFVNVGSALVVTGATTMQSGFSSNGGSTVSGTLTVSSGLATSGSNQNSPLSIVQGAFYNGGSIFDGWSMQDVVGTGTNPTSTLTFAHLPGSGWTGTSSISFPAITATSLVTNGSAGITSSFSNTGNGGALTAINGNTSGYMIAQGSAAFNATFDNSLFIEATNAGSVTSPLVLSTSIASGTVGNILLAPNRIVVGTIGTSQQQFQHIANTGAIINTAYFQIATASTCAVTATIGNTCAITVNLPVTEPDTSYQVSGCTAYAAPLAIGNTGIFTTSSFSVNVFSFGFSSASGAGTLVCLVTHP